MRILVTGGFGFIGSHLVERLINNPANHVHVVDDLSTSPIDVGAFVSQLNRPTNLTWDSISIADFCSRPNEKPFKQIYHLASVVGPVGVLKHAGRIAEGVINDTARVVELAGLDNAKIVDVSTSEVYGGGRDGYCSERDFKIIQPKITVRLEYAVGKLAAEIALINATRVSALQATIVRPFNVAGPRQATGGGFVLPRFIGQALKGEPLTVYGDGTMIRAFTHVSDIVDGILAAMERGHNGEAYNLGNPANKTSILDLANRVIRLVGGNSQVKFVDPKVLFGPLFDEANDKYPDSDKSNTELGWIPKYDIDSVIGDAVSYIRTGQRA